MYEFSVQNEYNQTIELSKMQSEYQIISIAGLDPPNAQIYEIKNSGMDGNIYNDSSLEDRIITVTFSIEGPAEENRLNLYNYFKIKKRHRLFFENYSRSVYIDGYLESFPIGIFDQKEIAQASFRCPDPYFKDFITVDADLSSIQKKFEFPFSIEEPIPFSTIEVGEGQLLINKGDVETGMVIRFYAARGPVENPVITNAETGAKFQVDIEMDPFDEVKVNTIKMNKSVILVSGSDETNLVDDIVQGSTWLQLNPGGNTFIVNAVDGAENLDVYIDVNTLYQGV